MGCFSAPEFCPEGVTVLNSVERKGQGNNIDQNMYLKITY